MSLLPFLRPSPRFAEKFYFEGTPPARIKSPYGNKCLDYNYNNMNLYWHPCHGGANQVFYFENSQYADGYSEASRIKSTHGDGHCMDVNYGGGNTLIMYPCHDGNNQKFYFSS